MTGYTNASIPTTPGAFQTAFGGGAYDAFVTKVNAAGGVVYSTYLGGSGATFGYGIAVDSSGNAYVTGSTDGGFPTTPGAYQTTYGGGASDAFVTKLNATGSALVYSTYLGGSGDEGSNGIAVDASGNAYVTGATNGGFPTTPGAYQTTHGGGISDAFVTKLSAAGSALLYSTYLGGSGSASGSGIAVDGRGNAYVTGHAGGDFPITVPFSISFPGPPGVGAFAVKFAADPVVAPPTIVMAFGAASVPVGATTVLAFTITNPNATALTGVGFTDTLPAGLVVSTPNVLAGSCGGGTIVAAPGSASLSLSAATLLANGSCAFGIGVAGTSLGTKINVTSAVTSVEGGNGDAATASIAVVAVGPAATIPTLQQWAIGLLSLLLFLMQGVLHYRKTRSEM